MEEGSIGGYGSHLLHYQSLTDILDGPLELRAMVLPHKIIFEEARLSARHISATILSLLGRSSSEHTHGMKILSRNCFRFLGACEIPTQNAR